MRSSLRLLSLVALAGCSLLGGCTAWSTYPPVGDARIIEDPELPPVPSLVARAFLRVQDLDGRAGPVIFNLPAGTKEHFYTKVKRELGPESDMMLVPEQDAVHLHQIRLRATDAEVDVISRGPAGTARMTTVVFKQELGRGWRVVRTREWRIPVDVPLPSYRPPDEGGQVPPPDAMDG